MRMGVNMGVKARYRSLEPKLANDIVADDETSMGACGREKGKRQCSHISVLASTASLGVVLGCAISARVDGRSTRSWPLVASRLPVNAYTCFPHDIAQSQTMTRAQRTFCSPPQSDHPTYLSEVVVGNGAYGVNKSGVGWALALVRLSKRCCCMDSLTPRPTTPQGDDGKEDKSLQLGGSNNPITDEDLPPTPEKRRSARTRKHPRPSYLDDSAEPAHRLFVNMHGAQDAAQDAAPAPATNVDLNPSRGRVQLWVLQSVLQADTSPELLALTADKALDAAVNCQDPTLDNQCPEREKERMALLRRVCSDAAIVKLNHHDPTVPYATIVKRADLYIDPLVTPPMLDTVHDANHLCSLCGQIKSHPVL
ncbi:hypothetical protein C8F01DRAFT_1088625 [Mycena amicta]|nr:hypothetical protein C8F01DRAFT_1088625 [Mycena amicta]